MKYGLRSIYNVGIITVWFCNYVNTTNLYVLANTFTYGKQPSNHLSSCIIFMVSVDKVIYSHLKY